MEGNGGFLQLQEQAGPGGSVELASPSQPATVKVVGGQPCRLLHCVVLGPAAAC